VCKYLATLIYMEGMEYIFFKGTRIAGIQNSEALEKLAHLNEI